MRPASKVSSWKPVILKINSEDEEKNSTISNSHTNGNWTSLSHSEQTLLYAHILRYQIAVFLNLPLLNLNLDGSGFVVVVYVKVLRGKYCFPGLLENYSRVT